MIKLRVLIITSKFPRFEGDAQPPFTFDLAKELVKKNCEVHVIAPHDCKSKLRELFHNIHVYRFRYFLPARLQKLAYGPGIPANIRTSLWAKIQIPFFLLSEILFARRIIKRIDPDIVHAHWAIPQGVAALFLGRPFIMTVYGGEVFLAKNFHIIPVFNYLIKKSKGAYAITLGLRDLMREFGITGRIGVIPLGVDLKKFRPGIKGWKSLRKKYCKPNEFMLLSVGRLVEKKGIHYLLPAFAKVLEKVPNCKLVIVGDGYMYNSLLRQTEELGIRDKVVFAREINHTELPKHYCSADLFVLPSTIDKTGNRETQGVVLLEAMACKCPVIGTKTGGIPDVISNNKVGMLALEKNPDALEKAMMKILTNKKLRERYAESAYNHVVKHFNWRDIANSYSKIYKKVIK